MVTNPQAKARDGPGDRPQSRRAGGLVAEVKAELHGRSLEQELRDILKRAAELTTEEKLALVDRIRAMTPQRLDTDSADLIREDRDTR